MAEEKEKESYARFEERARKYLSQFGVRPFVVDQLWPTLAKEMLDVVEEERRNTVEFLRGEQGGLVNRSEFGENTLRGVGTLFAKAIEKKRHIL